MTAGQQKKTVEEYLADEERSQERHEYVAGEVYAMVGGTLRHNRITGNIYVALRAALKGSGCQTFVTDVKLRVREADAFFYPDLFVECGKGERAGTATFATEARLVIEVLSESTEAYDHGAKMLLYRKLPSLQEYVLVWQDRRVVEVFRRADIGWTHLVFENDDVVRLESVSASVPVSTIYEDTDVA